MAEKVIVINERGLTSADWTVYNNSTKRTRHSAVPTTHPLALRKDGTWYTYGWDLTKNICEVFGAAGYIRTPYSYKPYGEVISSGDVEHPIQWSSEYTDSELALVYYNYRHYNPVDGRWIGRDKLEEAYLLYKAFQNNPFAYVDIMGDYLLLVVLTAAVIAATVSGCSPQQNEKEYNIKHLTFSSDHCFGITFVSYDSHLESKITAEKTCRDVYRK